MGGPGYRSGDVKPLYSFSDIQTFARLHRQATEQEYHFEFQRIIKFNDEARQFKAWPLMVVGPARWLLLVAPGQGDAQLPKEGESCIAEVLEPNNGKNISKSSISRVGNPCADLGIQDEFWQSCLAFEIKLYCNDSTSPAVASSQLWVPPTVTLSPAISAKDLKEKKSGTHSLSGPPKWSLKVIFVLRLSTSTRDAEIGALDMLLDAQADPEVDGMEDQAAAFEYFVTLKPKQTLSLFDRFPHMIDPSTFPAKLRDRFVLFNTQQMYAYRTLLGSIPDGICMVPGGPGAGKTFWNLSVAAAMQSKNEIKKAGENTPSKSHNKVLYLLDMNRPLTDVANKMSQVYRDLGFTKYCCDSCKVPQPRSVIRMFCWSYESSRPTHGYITAQKQELIERKERLEAKKRGLIAVEGGRGPLAEYDAKKDTTERIVLQGFASSFLRLRKKFTNPAEQRLTEQDCLAKTLDEAASEFFERHRDTRYADVQELLAVPCTDLKAVRDYSIERLYRDTLATADFYCYHSGHRQ